MVPTRHWKCTIQSYEFAYCMQSGIPAMIHTKTSTDTVCKLYGIDGREADKFRRACLLARRFTEAGVRLSSSTTVAGIIIATFRKAWPSIAVRPINPSPVF